MKLDFHVQLSGPRSPLPLGGNPQEKRKPRKSTMRNRLGTFDRSDVVGGVPCLGYLLPHFAGRRVKSTSPDPEPRALKHYIMKYRTFVNIDQHLITVRNVKYHTTTGLIKIYKNHSASRESNKVLATNRSSSSKRSSNSPASSRMTRSRDSSVACSAVS